MLVDIAAYYIYNLYIYWSRDESSIDFSGRVVVMPFAVNDFIQVISTFSQEGNEAQMVSFWRIEAINELAEGSSFAEAFAFHMMNIGSVEDVMSTTAGLIRNVINNLTSPLFFSDWSGLITGTVSGDPAPSFNTISIKQSGGSRITRNGYKRIPFITDSGSAGNNPNVSTTVRTALESFYGSSVNLVYTAGLTSVDVFIKPVIVGRTNMGTPEAPDYQLDLSRVQDVVSANVHKVTSQNSRKV